MSKKRLVLFLVSFACYNNMFAVETDLIDLYEKMKLEMNTFNLAVHVREYTGMSSVRIIQNNVNDYIYEVIDLINSDLIYFESDEHGLGVGTALVFALQSADYEKYKDFLIALSESYAEGKVDDILMHFALNSWGDDTRIYMEYKDLKIQEALNNCIKYKEIGKRFKVTVKSILNGSRYRRCLFREWSDSNAPLFSAKSLPWMTAYIKYLTPYLLGLLAIIALFVVAIARLKL